VGTYLLLIEIISKCEKGDYFIFYTLIENPIFVQEKLVWNSKVAF